MKAEVDLQSPVLARLRRLRHRILELAHHPQPPAVPEKYNLYSSTPCLIERCQSGYEEGSSLRIIDFGITHL
jgi:hypothetical protein